MEKDKKKNLIIYVLVGIIIILICLIGYFVVNKKLDNNLKENNSTTTTTSTTLTTTISKNEVLVDCDNYDGNEKCLLYKDNYFEIVKEYKPNANSENNYYINGKLVGSFVEFNVKRTIENNYIIIDNGLLSENSELYDKSGNIIHFTEVENLAVALKNMEYKNNILTLTVYGFDDNMENTICEYRPSNKSLNDIGYIKQEAKIVNGKLSNPTTIEKLTYKEIAKKFFNKDC